MKNISDYEKVMRALDEFPGVKEHMESLSVKLAMKIIKNRIKKNMTRTELGELCGLNAKIINDIECGDKNISILNYENAMNALGIKFTLE